MEIFLIFMFWGIAGVFPWQFIILRTQAKQPNRPINKNDYLKAVPFGPIIWLAYFTYWLLTLYIGIKNATTK